MSSKRHVIIMTKDTGTSRVLNGLFKSRNDTYAIDYCESLNELISRLDATPTAAALIDMDPSPRHMLGALDPVTTRFSAARFILLSEHAEQDLLLGAMQIGARHLLAKEKLEGELLSVLDRLTPLDSREHAPTGAIVTVLSAGGGCGATTVAVNLAAEAVRDGNESVLLVDLDVHYGAVGSYLGIQAEYGVDHVLARRERIDEELLKTTATRMPDGLSVLPSPASLLRSPSGASLHLENLSEFLLACRRGFSLNVLDAPRISTDAALQLASASVQTLLVIQASVKDVRLARRLLEHMSVNRVSPKALTVVVSRYRRFGAIIPLAELRTALEGWPMVLLPRDDRHAARSLNLGRPLCETSPRSRMRKELQRMSAAIRDAAGQVSWKTIGETRR